MRSLIPFFIVTASVAPLMSLAESPTAPAGEGKSLTLKHCVVSLASEAKIPARKPGVILRFGVAEGSFVRAGDEVAHIDDAEAQLQLKVAQRQFEAAQRRAENDIDVRYARAAALVNKAEVLAALEANARVPDTVPASELRRLQLDENRAILGIEQAESEFALGAIDARIAAAQAEAAELEINSRRITSPIDGIVVRLFPNVGEWVDAGQSVCQVVGMDQMRVTGFVNVNEYDQSTLLGREATVTVRLADGSIEKFQGPIGFASPIVQPDGGYRVWAVLENRRLDSTWVLRPGLSAQMSIKLP